LEPEGLNDAQRERYARHLVLPDVGEKGQVRLLGASVLVVGAGGLGSPALLYLSAAGVGKIGIVDHDVVRVSNLQRQIIHSTAMTGDSKVSSAAGRISELNPDVHVEAIEQKLTHENALSIIEGYDVVLDGEIYPSVSGHHTLIEFVEDDLWVEDLGSRNGTYVDGETITRTKVNLGTQIQLGTIGPRFAVVSSEPLSQTMFVDPKSVRAAVGSVSESKVEEMVQSRARRTYLRVTLLSAVLIALLGWWGTNAMRTSSDEISASLEEASAAQRERDAQVADELRLARGVIERLQELNTLREEERIESERNRETLALALKSRVDERESAAVALSDRLGALEGDNEQGEEIQRLSRMIEETQAELREARTQLTSFNPVNLEQARLAGVSHVRRTVVLLEVEVALVNSETMESPIPVPVV